MEYRCQDLPQYGVVLLPPPAPEYPALLSDIQQRLANPVPGSAPRMPDWEDPAAPAMILCNRSPTAIAAPSWIWKFEPRDGRPTGASVATVGDPSVLAPFGLDERLRRLYGYWHVILPGSKRVIRGSSLLGDNTDVRPPAPEELWKGGACGGGSSHPQLGPWKTVSLALDGVFFVDGGFAGPDTLRSFDRLTADVDAHLQVAQIARQGRRQGLSSAEIFSRIEAVTGPDRGPAPPPPPPPFADRAESFLQDCLRNLASNIGMMRQLGQGGDQVLDRLISWTETPLPHFRKL